MTPRFAIGQSYRVTRKGRTTDFVIEDIYTTFNTKGEAVKLHYVTSHQFMGQKLMRYDVTDTEIARSGLAFA